MLAHTQTDLQDVSQIWTQRRLSERLADWLQVEAVLGVAVLLCVALLSAFAGTLATVPSSPTGSGTTTGSFSATETGTATHGPFVQTQHKQGYTVTLRIAPDSFGTNTFSVKVQDAQGHPAQGSAVVIETTMLDMDMGTQQTQLQAVPSSPGTFSGQSDLTMAGHWQVIVLLLPPNQKKFVHYTFTFSAE